MKLRHSPISIPADGIWLDGSLAHAPDVRGLVIVVQSGASPVTHRREADIAAVLEAAGFATLTLDLLTRHEEQRDPDAGFNIARLTERILAAVDWVDHQPPLSALPTGLLASGTASAAVIRAAVKSPARFGALVCLAGRPDLAGANPLRSLRVPVLFVVGRDDPGTAIQRQAFEMIPGVRQWDPTEGAEPEHVSRQELAASTALAARWFAQALPAVAITLGDGVVHVETETPHPPAD